MFPHRLFCHDGCKESSKSLRQYVKATPGAGYFNTDYHEPGVLYVGTSLAPPNSYVLCHEETALAHPGTGHEGEWSGLQWFEKCDGLWVQRTFDSPYKHTW